MAKDAVDIEIENDKQLSKLFKELIPAVQHKIVIGGFRTAAKEISGEAKRNLKASTNITKTTGTNAVKIQKLNRAIGVKLGIENYKLRWIEWGTEERSYKKGVKRSVWRKRQDSGGAHETGKINPTHFFYDAVKSKEAAANSKISSAIRESLEKTIKKYDKMK